MSSSNSSLVVQMTTDQLKSLFLDALRDVLGGKNMDISSSAPAKGKRGTRKPRDPDAPKKEPNDWIKFTSRVRSVLAPQMEDGKKVAPKAVTQVSSALKDASLMTSATDAQIIAAYKNWLANPPAVSKMVAAGRDKKSKKSKGDASDGSSDGSSVASSSKSAPAPAPAEASADGKKKGRKPMTDEQKAAAKAKRDAKKAAKSSSSASAESSPPAEDAAADSSADFEPFKWKKMSLLKNARGDVLTEDMEWFGKWDSVKNNVDTNAPQPDDLEL